MGIRCECPGNCPEGDSPPGSKSHEEIVMARPEDIGNILTTHDLSAYLEKKWSKEAILV